ncbi:O-antigen polymerase [Leptospira brenneri]|uniref:Oligosaccharide repeat unit polymerase n=1 Tax=Leptospira brenneri TaxID=2023182 RepID=A0A2M9Y1P6_9LEPT|nr:O-antigen polymerase [Leptospira brenneri]PJZ45494.1 hypothetical protein CH361_10735 [Leptospira brenneri]TGK91986.1 oligosaccharide repeat unit polymerase [Leptospira brenneri]
MALVITFLFYFLLIVFLCIRGFRSIALIIILVWWGLWNVLSYCSISGLYTISFYTQCIYFLFFLFIVLAFFMYNFLFGKPSKKNTNVKKNRDFYNVLLWISICFVLPVQIFFASRTIYILSFVMSPGMYRNDVFGFVSGSPTIFFHSNQLALLHALIIGPFQYIYLFAGISFSVLRKKNALLLVGVSLVILDSLIMFGRFGYHYLIIAVILGLVFVTYFNGFAKLRSNLLKAFVPIFILLLLTFWITLYRGSRSFLDIINMYVVTYHTESFSIFDTELKNPGSILHQYSYGLSMLGGIERYWVLFLNKFGFMFVSQTDIVGGYLHRDFNIGIDRFSNPIFLNAFGSIFFTMFRDGGILGIVAFGIFFGMILAFYSDSLKQRDPYGFSILLGLIFLLIYGIFQPTTLGPMLPALLFLFLVNFIVKLYNKV